MNIDNLCPVCGYELPVRPWTDGSPSDYICPCCGIQFGYDDLSQELRLEMYKRWRRMWIGKGMKWWSRREPPPNWNPLEQMCSAGIDPTSL